MSEADLINLLIEASLALDANFEFWLTASFAMLIASYLVSERVPFAVFLVTMFLYLLATVLFMLRGMTMGRMLTSLRDQLESMGTDTALIGPGENLAVAGLYFLIMIVGSIATVAFVYWRYRKCGRLGASEHPSNSVLRYACQAQQQNPRDTGSRLSATSASGASSLIWEAAMP